jgi:hypothetical protein
MDESSLPRIHGYSKVNSHLCPRCDKVVRVLYRATGETPEKENSASSLGLREERFATGTLLIASDHVDGSWGVAYPYYGPCGYLVPMLMDSPESYINQLYTRLEPSFYGFNPSYSGYYQRPSGKTQLRIVSFDVSKFLAAPWVLWAQALEKGQPPIALMPHPSLLRASLVHGSIPGPQTQQQTVSAADADATQSLFLAAIGATTEERTF